MIEPEEIIESRIAALLDAAQPGIPVVGALEPSPDGEEKKIPDTCILVVADVASQDMDAEYFGIPCTYTVRVAVHYAFADGKTGADFRDTCRAVRGALTALLGDGCAALSDEGFYCDSFTLDGTSTAMESMAYGEGMTKSYTATVKGRLTPPTETQEDL